MTAPSTDYYSTIIVGAGPAGILAAVHAAERGRVLLLDNGTLPRSKSCGGMLHALSLDMLKEYGRVPEDIVRDPRTVRFRYNDWDRRILKPTDVTFLNVDRVAFDAWLLTLLPSNVEVVARATVTGVSQTQAAVTCEATTDAGPVTVRADLLIGADGARSQVRRSLGLRESASYVTLQDFVTLDSDIEPFFDCIYMRHIGDEYAYSYVVPKGGVAYIGSVFYPRTKRPWEKQDQIVELLRTRIPQLGARQGREASAALYLRTPDDVLIGAGRVLLAGEAGGFMSPTSGEGISYALRTGRLAGQAAADADPEGALTRYETATQGIRADIRRRFRWLPFMESRVGKYLAGFVPAPVVSRVTMGL